MDLNATTGPAGSVYDVAREAGSSENAAHLLHLAP